MGTFAPGCAFSYTPLTRVPATRMVVHESTLYRATTPRRCRGPFAPRTFPGSYTDTRLSLCRSFRHDLVSTYDAIVGVKLDRR